MAKHYKLIIAASNNLYLYQTLTVLRAQMSLFPSLSIESWWHEDLLFYPAAKELKSGWYVHDINYNITHTHPFNGPFSGTTQVSRYQKGRTNLDFTEARDSEWQWHQLGHMQVCTLLQTDNHASTPPLCFYRPDALPAAQPTASKHWRQKS